MDPSQDYVLLLGIENATHTSLRFRRKLRTCDEKYDVAITVSLHWSYICNSKVYKLCQNHKSRLITLIGVEVIICQTLAMNESLKVKFISTRTIDDKSNPKSILFSIFYCAISDHKSFDCLFTKRYNENRSNLSSWAAIDNDAIWSAQTREKDLKFKKWSFVQVCMKST